MKYRLKAKPNYVARLTRLIDYAVIVAAFAVAERVRHAAWRRHAFGAAVEIDQESLGLVRPLSAWQPASKLRVGSILLTGGLQQRSLRLQRAIAMSVTTVVFEAFSAQDLAWALLSALPVDSPTENTLPARF